MLSFYSHYLILRIVSGAQLIFVSSKPVNLWDHSPDIEAMDEIFLCCEISI